MLLLLLLLLLLRILFVILWPNLNQTFPHLLSVRNQPVKWICKLKNSDRYTDLLVALKDIILRERIRCTVWPLIHSLTGKRHFDVKRIVIDEGRKRHNRVLTSHIFPAFVCSLQPACLNRYCGLVRLLASHCPIKWGTTCFSFFCV